MMKNETVELLARLASLSEAWKDLTEKTDGKRPDVPLIWSVDDTGLLYLDNKWVCPMRFLDTERLFREDLSSFVADVTIFLPTTEGSLDLIIIKEFGAYEFSIIERSV